MTTEAPQHAATAYSITSCPDDNRCSTAYSNSIQHTAYNIQHTATPAGQKRTATPQHTATPAVQTMTSAPQHIASPAVQKTTAAPQHTATAYSNTSCPDNDFNFTAYSYTSCPDEDSNSTAYSYTSCPADEFSSPAYGYTGVQRMSGTTRSRHTTVPTVQQKNQKLNQQTNKITIYRL